REDAAVGRGHRAVVEDRRGADGERLVFDVRNDLTVGVVRLTRDRAPPADGRRGVECQGLEVRRGRAQRAVPERHAGVPERVRRAAEGKLNGRGDAVGLHDVDRVPGGVDAVADAEAGGGEGDLAADEDV